MLKTNEKTKSFCKEINYKQEPKENFSSEKDNKI